MFFKTKIMRKLLILLLMFATIGCSAQDKLTKSIKQDKLSRSIKKAKKQTMRDFKRGKIKVDYPILTP